MREIVKINPVSCRRDHTMTVKKHSANTINLKALVAEDCDWMKSLIKAAVQEVLEAEMTELVGAGPHERQDGCQGYR